MDPSYFAQKLTQSATNFVGLSETKSNAEWDDKRTRESEKIKSDLLIKYMRKVRGWTPGAAYCAAGNGAMVAITLEALGYPTESKKFLSRWTAHVMTNVGNCMDWECLSSRPVMGSLWLAQHGTTSRGHEAMVTSVLRTSMGTLEFNTSGGATADPELQRNGDGIYLRLRNIKANGTLFTKGFVSPSAILRLAGFTVK